MKKVFLLVLAIVACSVFLTFLISGSNTQAKTTESNLSIKLEEAENNFSQEVFLEGETTLVFQQGLNGYFGCEDTYIYYNYCNKGLDKKLAVFGGNGTKSRSLIRFNLSELPENAVISSAVLSLYPYQVTSLSPRISVHELENNKDWIENSANSSLFNCTENLFWSGDYADEDFDTVALDAQNIVQGEWSSWNVINAVQESIDNGSRIPNFLVKYEDELVSGYSYFASCNNSFSSLRPILTVSYVLGSCLDGETRSCNTGELGVCSAGTSTCFDGNWSQCTRIQEPLEESETAGTCFDLLDNDCDGFTDNDPECPEPPAVLTHGGIAGAVTSNSAKVYARADKNASMQIEYSVFSDLNNSMFSDSIDVNSDTDFSVMFSLNDLNSNTIYYYSVLVDGVRQNVFPFPSFETFPFEGIDSSFSFVYTADQTDGNHLIFEKIGDENALFFFTGGDFGYPDSPLLQNQRLNFQRQYDPKNAFYYSVLKKTPLFGIWDDHDFGKNDADKTLANKEQALYAWKENFPLPELVSPESGLWYSFKAGNAEFFVADLRYNRDPDNTLGGSMLGDTNLTGNQRQWLVNAINSSSARWKFVMFSLPFNGTDILLNGTSNDHEPWSTYDPVDAERNYLVENIRTQNVIILSGDRHFSAIDNRNNSDFPEMLVAPVNRHILGASGSWSEGTYNSSNAYGVIRINSFPSHSVDLEVYNASGTKVLSYNVPHIKNYC